MCAICGCSPHDHGHPHDHGASHVHDPTHEHGETHTHDHGHGQDHRLLHLELDLLAKNDRIAQENRSFLAARRSVAFNLVGSPGAGKTSLLEELIPILARNRPVAVLEGDQETELDAERIRRTGVPVLQINTGSGCHLNARMVGESLRRLEAPEASVIFVENVGNLVCPALFDIGEHAKMLVVSVTEGADKPAKYPQIFREAHAMVLNKIDLLPHLDLDLHTFMERARRVNPDLRIFPVSCTKGLGLQALQDWLITTVSAETMAEAR